MSFRKIFYWNIALEVHPQSLGHPGAKIGTPIIYTFSILDQDRMKLYLSLDLVKIQRSNHNF